MFDFILFLAGGWIVAGGLTAALATWWNHHRQRKTQVRFLKGPLAQSVRVAAERPLSAHRAELPSPLYPELARPDGAEPHLQAHHGISPGVSASGVKKKSRALTEVG